VHRPAEVIVGKEVHPAVTDDRRSCRKWHPAPIEARPSGPALGGAAARPHERAGAVGGLGEVEQVSPLSVVELQRSDDCVEDCGGRAGQRPALKLGVVLDTHPGQSGDLAATQAGDPTAADLRQARLLRSELGSPRDEEIADLGAVVHVTDSPAQPGPLGMPCQYMSLQRLPHTLSCRPFGGGKPTRPVASARQRVQAPLDA
jgi:hypothetical protein